MENRCVNFIVIMLMAFGLFHSSFGQSIDEAKRIIEDCYSSQKNFSFSKGKALRIVVRQTTVPKSEKGDIQDVRYEMISNGNRKVFFSPEMDVIQGDSLLAIAYHDMKKLTLDRLQENSKGLHQHENNPMDMFFHCLSVESAKWEKNHQLSVEMVGDVECSEKYGISSVVLWADTVTKHLNFMKVRFQEKHPLQYLEYRIEVYDPLFQETLVTKGVKELIGRSGELEANYADYKIVRTPQN